LFAVFVEATGLPVMVGGLLRSEAVVDTEEVRGRVDAAGLTTGSATVRGVFILTGALLAVDTLLKVEGALLTVEIALLLTDAVVDVEVVRDRDGPASELGWAVNRDDAASGLATGVIGFTTDFETASIALAVPVVRTDLADGLSGIPCLGDGRVTSCLGGPLIDLGIVLVEGLGLEGRGRPIATVVLAFAAVGLRARGPRVDRGMGRGTGTERELAMELVEAELERRRRLRPLDSAGVEGPAWEVDARLGAGTALRILVVSLAVVETDAEDNREIALGVTAKRW